MKDCPAATIARLSGRAHDEYAKLESRHLKGELSATEHAAMQDAHATWSTLYEAIGDVKATSPEGALAQLGALASHLELHEDIPHDQEAATKLISSIARILARQCDHTLDPGLSRFYDNVGLKRSDLAEGSTDDLRAA